MIKALAVSLRPENTLLIVRKSSARPSEICAIIANPSRPVVLSEITFTSACITLSTIHQIVWQHTTLHCRQAWGRLGCGIVDCIRVGLVSVLAGNLKEKRRFYTEGGYTISVFCIR